MSASCLEIPVVPIRQQLNKSCFDSLLQDKNIDSIQYIIFSCEIIYFTP